MMLSTDDVVNKLLGESPISIIRVGDGEGLVLNSQSSITAEHLCSTAVLRRQMGYDPTVEQIKEIRNNLISAYSNCDVIGIPQHKQKTNSHWANVKTILDQNVPNHTETYCDIDIAYQMLDNGGYDKVLQNRKVLSYISCRDLDEGFHNKWNIHTINQYLISPEAKFTSGYTGEVHYPNQFNKISRWVDVQLENYPNSLLFVGAGVIGKIYCNWWRDRGGVAMDVGAVMDCWSGKVTRGPERGLDKEDLTYKL